MQQDNRLSFADLAERVGSSAASCVRRVKRLRRSGLIAREVALLDADRLAPLLGHGLTVLVEITLERQGAEAVAAFEARAVAEPAVQQCYRVSPGPDLVLVVRCADMPDYLALTQRLFTGDANVRNVKGFFSTRCAKFDPRLPLRRPA